MLGLPLGLETLLADLLGVELDADKARMQRADWERRPLSQEMIEYAAGDVADLPALWSLLEIRLREAGREPWYREELAAALALPPAEERRDWRRVKGIGRLHPLPRARVQALWERREELARSTDTSASRIAPDRVLIELAQDPPSKVRGAAAPWHAGGFGPALRSRPARGTARRADGRRGSAPRRPLPHEGGTRPWGPDAGAADPPGRRSSGSTPASSAPAAPSPVASPPRPTPRRSSVRRSVFSTGSGRRLRDLFTDEFDLDAEAPAA